MPGAMPLCAEQLFVQAEALAVHRLAFSMFILPSFLPSSVHPPFCCTILHCALEVTECAYTAPTSPSAKNANNTTSHDNFQAQQHLGMCIHTVQAQQISSLEM
jgi:hypothetical protein